MPRLGATIGSSPIASPLDRVVNDATAFRRETSPNRAPREARLTDQKYTDGQRAKEDSKREL